MKNNQKSDLQRRMFRLIAGFLLTLFAGLSILISIYAYRNSLKSSEILLQETTENSAQKLEQMIDNMDAISVQLAANNTIQRIFQNIALSDSTGNYFEDHFQIRKNVELECSSINMAPNMVDAIYIFSEPDDFFSYNTERYNKKQVIHFFESNDIGVYKDYANQYYKVLKPHKNPWTDDENSKVISLVRPLVATYYSREQVATLEVQYQFSKVQRKCFQENKNDIAVMLIDNSTGELIYPEEKTENNNYSGLFDVEADKVHFVKNKNGQSFAVYRYNLNNCDWSIYGIQEYRTFMSPVRIILSLIIILCIGFSALALMGVFLVTRHLTMPIRNLRKALKEITLDNVIIPSEYEGNNEIELLQERFQQVLTALQHSANQLAISQTAEYKARIEALQAQINPHFLYNSLMSISAAGQEGDALKIQNMCSQLSDIFRYASSGGAEATLADELASVEDYLTFMKFRYLDDLDFSIQRNENCEDVMVPKLILQPIIENCFRHGFYMVVPPFFVDIKCTINDGRWLLEVRDNGGGFSEDKLSRIKEVKSKIDENFAGKKQVRHIDTDNMALLNVYARLKVRYDGETVFEIGNLISGGAVVRIGGKLNEDKIE